MTSFDKFAGISVIAYALAAGGVCAETPKPQAISVPADCLSLDVSPYSAPEALTIHSSKTVQFQVEIASTPETREQGLMCRSNLSSDYGMLFEFPDVRERTFWMKDTVSALDILYIAPDGRIVSIQKNARALDETPLPSYGDASGVLEIRAGLSDQLGIKPGDIVMHPFFHKP